jgi:hypothetical protein
LPAVLYFSRNNLLGYRNRLRPITRGLVLGAPQQDITRHRTFQPRFKPAISIKQDKSATVFAAAPHESGAYEDIAKTNHSAEMM